MWRQTWKTTRVGGQEATWVCLYIYTYVCMYFEQLNAYGMYLYIPIYAYQEPTSAQGCRCGSYASTKDYSPYMMIVGWKVGGTTGMHALFVLQSDILTSHDRSNSEKIFTQGSFHKDPTGILFLLDDHLSIDDQSSQSRMCTVLCLHSLGNQIGS